MQEAIIGGCKVFTLTPRHRATRRIVLFTHGGSYVYEPQTRHWGTIENLIRSTGASMFVPIYPLAPEHTFEQTYALLETLYRGLLTNHQSDEIVLCGDSAGGGLALGQVLLHKRQGLPLPRRIVLLAPWLDLTLSNPDIEPIRIARRHALAFGAADDGPLLGRKRGSRVAAPEPAPE